MYNNICRALCSDNIGRALFKWHSDFTCTRVYNRSAIAERQKKFRLPLSEIEYSLVGHYRIYIRVRALIYNVPPAYIHLCIYDGIICTYYNAGVRGAATTIWYIVRRLIYIYIVYRLPHVQYIL